MPVSGTCRRASRVFMAVFDEPLPVLRPAMMSPTEPTISIRPMKVPISPRKMSSPVR